MSEPDYSAILAPLREVIDRLHDRAKTAEAKLAAVEALADEMGPGFPYVRVADIRRVLSGESR